MMTGWFPYVLGMEGCLGASYYENDNTHAISLPEECNIMWSSGENDNTHGISSPEEYNIMWSSGVNNALNENVLLWENTSTSGRCLVWPPVTVVTATCLAWPR